MSVHRNGVLVCEEVFTAECKSCHETMEWSGIWEAGDHDYDEVPDIDEFYAENGPELSLCHTTGCEEGGIDYHRDDWACELR